MIVKSILVVGKSTIRIGFDSIPFAANPNNLNDALNLGNYSISFGMVIGVTSVLGSPYLVDITIDKQFPVGANSVTVSNVTDTLGNVVAATPNSFWVSATVGNYLDGLDPEKLLLANANPALNVSNSKEWKALYGALATGDRYVQNTLELASNQMNLTTASGKYLKKRVSELGLDYPTQAPIGESYLAQVASLTANSSQTTPCLQDLVSLIYPRKYNSTIESIPGPYVINNHDDLILEINGVVHTVLFQSEAFILPSEATSLEVSVYLGNYFAVNGIELYSYQGSVLGTVVIAGKDSKTVFRVLGGAVQKVLRFPKIVNIYLGNPIWTISIPKPGTVRFTPDTGTTDLSSLSVGDTVYLSSSTFSEANRGWFDVTRVYRSVVGGVLVQYFEVNNPNGIAEVTSTQTNPDNLMVMNNTLSTPVVLGTELSLPAVSNIFASKPIFGAYVMAKELPTPTSIVNSGGTISVVSPNHGLSGTVPVFVSGAKVSYSDPGQHSGQTSTAPYDTDWSIRSFASTLADTNNSGCYRHNSFWISGRVMIIGGMNKETTTYRNKAEFLLATNGSNPGQFSYQWYTDAAPGTTFIWAGGISPSSTTGFICGGRNAGGWLNTTLLYTVGSGTSNGTWSSLANLNTARAGHAIVLTSASEPLVFGGCSSNTATLNSIEVYRASSWVTQTNMVVARNNPVVVSLGANRFLICGGRTMDAATKLEYTNTTELGTPLADCEIFDLTTNTSTAIKQMNYPRVGHAAYQLSDKRVVVLGGKTVGGGFANSIEIYDPNYDTWTVIGQLNYSFEFGQIAYYATGNRLYIYGGYSNNSEYLDLNTLSVCSSLAKDTKQRLFSQLVYLEIANRLLCVRTGGLSDDSTSSLKSNGYLNLGIENIAANGINGAKQVSVVDSNTLTYPSNSSLDYGLCNNPSEASLVCTNNQLDIKNNYYFSDSNETVISGVHSGLVSQLTKGAIYSAIELTDASSFPDSGELVLGYGFDYQVKLGWIAKQSANVLILNKPFSPAKTIPSNTVANLTGAVALSNNQRIYLYGSNWNTNVVRSWIESVLPVGSKTKITWDYPDDTGLGNAGFADNPKISDKVWVWGQDNVDLARQEAYNGL